MPVLPIIFTTPEDKSFLSDLGHRILSDPSLKNTDYLLKYPIVYIHYWEGKPISYEDKKGHKHSYPRYNVYVGESNDVISRTREHYAASDDSNKWQYHLTHDGKTPQMIVIGHEHFNKSFTLDMENRLIEYIMSMRSVSKLYNGRGNPQNEYYPDVEFPEVFNSVWKQLRAFNRDLFLPKREIEHSALFKASPLKKLTSEQIDAKETILAKIQETYANHLDGQLIFVQGEAGTGKTVLNSSLFYDLITKGEELFGKKLDCHMMVNHDQQLTVYEQLASRLDLGDDIVHKPTSFINKYSPSSKVDISFIDEGHLLLTQGKMSYRGKNQLEDIIARSRVTVVMFDEYQVLTAEEYWEPEILEKFKNLSHRQHNYIGLSRQLRMTCSDLTKSWMDDFILNQRLSKLSPDPDYEIRFFDSPSDLHAAIKDKSAVEESRLSRVVASYDWNYESLKRPESSKYWGVKIGDWFLPWNYETEGELSKKERRAISKLAWAEQPHTIDEVGSTFTIQGFDLSYVGVILGPSVKYIDGEIVFDPEESKNDKATQNRTLSDGKKASFGKTFIRNEIKVLMSRGVKGLYIYACDPALRKALKECR